MKDRIGYMSAAIAANAMVSALLVATAGCASESAGSILETPESAMQSQVAPAEMPIARMKVAKVSGKITVPVEVRYQFDDAPVSNQPVPLQIALVSRAAGENLKVEFVNTDALIVDTVQPQQVQKVAVDGVVRHRVLVTAKQANPPDLRLLVSMDTAGGRFFGVFSIPVGR